MIEDGLTPESQDSIVVMGMGNVLLKDEGVGVHVIRMLEEWNLPASVRLIDAGTAALDMLQIIGAVKKLIVVDTVKGGGKPGSVYKFKPSDIKSSERALSSLHQLGFMEALSIAERIGEAPRDVTIIGVEPGDISFGLELSSEIKNKLPDIISAVLELIPDSR